MFWILFLIFLLACFSAGATGGLFPPGSWYSSLKKPSWTPPNWLFPVAWTSLYICMSFAGEFDRGYIFNRLKEAEAVTIDAA